MNDTDGAWARHATADAAFALADLGAGGTLPQVWSRQWTAAPHHPVLIDGAAPQRRLSGEALGQQTSLAAATLAERGVQRHDRVLWSCFPSLDSIVGLLSALRLGAVVVPVNPTSTRNELKYVLDDVNPTFALVDGPHYEEWLRSDAPGVGACSPEELLGHTPTRHQVTLDVARPDDDALIVYTSGTTGRPKGAVHTHRSLLAGVQALRIAWGWQPDDCLILCLPLFHVHGLCAGLFGTLAAGASALVFGRFSPELVLDAAPKSTMFFGVPTMYHRLDGSGRARELSMLRLCVAGSAPLPAELWRRFNGNGVSVLERYGMSETLLTLSNPLFGERRPGSVGFPLPGVEAAIEAPDPQGIGELMVRGPSICRGYWNRPDEAGPLGADGWFATGDLASLESDGYFSIRGRRTELIITGGHNVYPAEVESVLSRHPSVAEIAVIGLASAEWGESVTAFVVGAGGEPDLDALEQLAAEELTSFKRPREYRVVDSLPRNAMGKVIRRDLH